MTPELLQRIAEAYRKSQTKDVTGLFLRLLLPQASERRRVIERDGS